MEKLAKRRLAIVRHSGTSSRQSFGGNEPLNLKLIIAKRQHFSAFVSYSRYNLNKENNVLCLYLYSLQRENVFESFMDLE